jgi:hypothetical protein
MASRMPTFLPASFEVDMIAFEFDHESSSRVHHSARGQ